MSPCIRIALFASLLTLGCQRSPERPTQPPPPAPAAPPPQATPNAEPREPTPASTERRVECRGGEVVATWQSAADEGGKAETAKLTFAAAGHRAWSYDFAYEGGVLASARHRISSWSFAGGDVDHPKTHDKVVDRRYELDAGKLASCTERRAEGAGDAVEQLVQDAPAKDIDCKQGAALVELAAHAARPIAGADVAWLSAACESDKSSGLKL